MKQVKLIAVSILLLASNLIYGQTLYATGEIHKISSFNKKYFLRTVPNEDAGRTKIGNTIVYKADSTELYKFPRYFDFGYYDQQVYLSKDGNTITDIVNRDINFSNYHQNCITIYKNGKLFKEYALHDIIDCDSEIHRECTLFYFDDAIENVSYDSNFKRTIIFKKNATDFEKQLTKNALYQSDDTLLIFCKMGQIIKLNLSTGDLIKEKLTTFNPKAISQYDTLHVQSYKVINPKNMKEFPKMINGKSTEEELADYMGMQNLPSKYSDKYKVYNLTISAVIDLNGNARVVAINNYEYNGIPCEDKIYSFFQSNKFETKYIPKEVDGWKYYCSVSLINKDLNLAEREKQEEIEKKQQQLNELIEQKKQHQQKRIDECSKLLDLELNKEIKPEDAEIIKSLKAIDNKSICHFKYPNDTSFTLSYLNTYKDLFKDFPVSAQLDNQVNFELRLWVSDMIGITGLFRLIYDDNGNWKAEKYVVEKRKVIYSPISLNINWNKLWDRLLVNNILTLPDNPEFKGKMIIVKGDTIYSRVAITDGTNYKVELLSKENNRKYSIDNPVGYYKFYTDSKPLKDFNTILEMLSPVYNTEFK